MTTKHPQPKRTGRLFLLPTPISDSPLTTQLVDHQRQVIGGLSHFLAENVRTARRFVSSLKLGLTIEELHFAEFNKDTAEGEIGGLLAPVLAGHDMGLMSEAGLPAVADPGARAVLWCHRQGVSVVPVVGPSSIPLAIAASGLGGQHFSFLGYAPIKEAQLKPWLKQVASQAQAGGHTLVFMDTPYRNDRLFAELLALLPAHLLLCVARDVTGPDEWIATRSVSDWKRAPAPRLHKVPCLFLVAKV